MIKRDHIIKNESINEETDKENGLSVCLLSQGDFTRGLLALLDTNLLVINSLGETRKLCQAE